jgi:hypothetical protein
MDFAATRRLPKAANLFVRGLHLGFSSPLRVFSPLPLDSALGLFYN